MRLLIACSAVLTLWACSAARPIPAVGESGTASTAAQAPSPDTIYTIAEVTTKPTLINTPEVKRLLAHSVPAALKEARISSAKATYGVVLDEGGIVRQVVVTESSGHPNLDLVGQRITRAMRFSPAKIGDRPVAVAYPIPMTFSVGR